MGPGCSPIRSAAWAGVRESLTPEPNQAAIVLRLNSFVMAVPSTPTASTNAISPRILRSAMDPLRFRQQLYPSYRSDYWAICA